MTAAQVLENAPDIKSLDSAISIRALQLALLQQQYAPTDPLLASNPLIATPTAELAGLNVGGSDFGSDKVTLGDATSVSQPTLSLRLTIDPGRPIRSTVPYADVSILVYESWRKRQRPSNPPNDLQGLGKSIMHEPCER